jgi:hypothetical protein
MGFKTTEICYGIDIPSVPKSVLLYLAHRSCDVTGSCFPSVCTIAKMTGLSERAVYEQISALKESGFLNVINRPNKSNDYTLTPLNGKNSWKKQKKNKRKEAKSGNSTPAPGSPPEHGSPPEPGSPPEHGAVSPCTGFIPPLNPVQVHTAPGAGDHKYQSEINQKIITFSAHAHATPPETQEASTSPQGKKDLVSVAVNEAIKPTGVISTGSRSDQPNGLDFRNEYFLQAKRLPGDRMSDLFFAWDNHKTGISKKGQWTDMHRKLFVGAMIRMENEHGTQIVCDRIEIAICGGYGAVIAPEAEKLANMSKRDLADKHSANYGYSENEIDF